MALGKRGDEQQEMWVATTSLPKSVGHIFYRKLNRLLAEADFDRTVEKMCEPYYHTHLGRPSIPPGVSGYSTDRGSARPFQPDPRPRSSAFGSACGRVPMGAGVGRREEIVAGQDRSGRCHHVGSRCGDEVDRAARHRRGLERISAASEHSHVHSRAEDQAVWNRDTEGLAGRGRPFRVCAVCAFSHLPPIASLSLRSGIVSC
jgi:hypothetical protein